MSLYNHRNLIVMRSSPIAEISRALVCVKAKVLIRQRWLSVMLPVVGELAPNDLDAWEKAS